MTILKKTAIYSLALPLLLYPYMAQANNKTDESKTAIEALQNGKVSLGMNYRYEFVEQDGLRNAKASTLRTALGYKTGTFKKIHGFLEFENVTEIGKKKHNDTISSDQSDRAVVADPQVSQVNQAYLNLEAFDNTNIKLGRQKIILDNQRFVGDVPWRQNDQTFDAINVTGKYFNHLTVSYSFIDRVNRIFGPDSAVGIYDDSEINLLNIKHDINENNKISTYHYSLDINAAPASSSRTTGVRYVGSHELNDSLKASYNLEYAYQSDHGDNITSYNADYILAKAAISHNNITLKAAYEELGSGGSASFQTSLATLHGFNGWADKFLTTPVNGLRDFHGTVKYKVKSENQYLNNIITLFTFHDFHSDRGNSHYGEEYNFLISKKFAKHYNAGFKAAYYKADELFTDTTKFMFFTGLSF